MYNKKINNLEVEVEAMKKDLEAIKGTAFYEASKKDLESKQKTLTDLKEKQKVLNDLKGLSVEEAKEKIANEGLKVPKDFIDSLEVELSRNNFKEALKASKMEAIELKIQDRSNYVVKGYLIHNDNEFYCLSYNHLAIKGTKDADGFISFKVNTNHDLYYKNNCLKVLKAFVIEVYDLFNLEITDDFKLKTVTDNRQTINISAVDLTNWLLSHRLDTKNKLSLPLSNEIEFNNDKLNMAVKELKY